jgi:tripartite ATP-independent transporter DctM subunit
VDPVAIGVLTIVALIALIFLHVPIGVAMIATGVLSFAALRGGNTAITLIATETVSALENTEISVVPLFLLMGGFAAASGLSADFYRLLNALVGHVRGGLAMATIGSCAGFGAVCGSSIATVATMTRIALPEMLGRGYGSGLATGSIAAGGTLGFLIPPSIAFIIYGFLTEQFIIALFVAAVLPGVLAVALHFAAIAIYAHIRPDAAPAGKRVSADEFLPIARQSFGAFVLAAIVAGGIYSGVFTVVEAAAVAAAASFAFYVIRARFAFGDLWEILFESGANTAMIYLVLIGAGIFNYTITLSGLPEVFITAIKAQDFPPYMVILALLGMYLVLGCIFESISAMVLTLPFVFPLVMQLGYDPLWWGVINVMVIEIGMITPPVGLNVLVLHGMARHIPLQTIFAGTAPFLGADTVRLLLLVAFPALATWLPRSFGY